MAETPTRIFISYSRTDSDFVDRLQADLLARNFDPWVDRSELEGGDNWLDTIQAAVESCQILLVVLSPEAVSSNFVRIEYRHALRKRKVVIPLSLRPTEVPFELNDIQWVDFQKGYEKGLQDLLIAINRIKFIPQTPVQIYPETPAVEIPEQESELDFVKPRPAPPPPDPALNALYTAALDAGDDLERRYVLTSQILERDPDFAGGLLKSQAEDLERRLNNQRAEILRQKGREAMAASEWRVATGIWRALLGLQPNNTEANKN